MFPALYTSIISSFLCFFFLFVAVHLHLFFSSASLGALDVACQGRARARSQQRPLRLSHRDDPRPVRDALVENGIRLGLYLNTTFT